MWPMDSDLLSSNKNELHFMELGNITGKRKPYFWLPELRPFKLDQAYLSYPISTSLAKQPRDAMVPSIQSKVPDPPVSTVVKTSRGNLPDTREIVSTKDMGLQNVRATFLNSSNYASQPYRTFGFGNPFISTQGIRNTAARYQQQIQPNSTIYDLLPNSVPSKTMIMKSEESIPKKMDVLLPRQLNLFTLAENIEPPLNATIPARYGYSAIDVRTPPAPEWPFSSGLSFKHIRDKNVAWYDMLKSRKDLQHQNRSPDFINSGNQLEPDRPMKQFYMSVNRWPGKGSKLPTPSLQILPHFRQADKPSALEKRPYRTLYNSQIDPDRGRRYTNRIDLNPNLYQSGLSQISHISSNVDYTDIPSIDTRPNFLSERSRITNTTPRRRRRFNISGERLATMLDPWGKLQLSSTKSADEADELYENYVYDIDDPDNPDIMRGNLFDRSFLSEEEDYLVRGRDFLVKKK